MQCIKCILAYSILPLFPDFKMRHFFGQEPKDKAKLELLKVIFSDYQFLVFEQKQTNNQTKIYIHTHTLLQLVWFHKIHLKAGSYLSIFFNIEQSLITTRVDGALIQSWDFYKCGRSVVRATYFGKMYSSLKLWLLAKTIICAVMIVSGKYVSYNKNTFYHWKHQTLQ